MSPTVRISSDHNSILEDAQERHEEEHGFSPNKKDMVENAIKETYSSDNDGQ